MLQPAGLHPTRSTLALLLVAVLAVVVAAPAVASAAPERANVTVEDGTAMTDTWFSCEATAFSAATGAPDGTPTIPAAGELTDSGELVVRSSSVVGGVATWVLAPTESWCRELEDEGGLDPEPVALRVRYRDRRYVVRAGMRTGVRQIANLRTSWGRSYFPNVRAARRAFGRPSKILPGPGRESCAMRWNHVGLRIQFLNLGTGSTCKRGYVQYAVITKPRLWAIAVGDRPAIVETSQPAYLETRERTVTSQEGWGLAEVFIPWGDPGYYPSVVGLGEGGFSRYDLWIGAGGD